MNIYAWESRIRLIKVIKYLKTFGFNISNETFAQNSWYFRNALNTELTLGSDSKKNELIAAMSGHILADAKIVGLYKNN